MSTAAALDFTYKYPFASAVGDAERGFGLTLATCGPRHEHPYFFEGRLRSPREMADMLLVLSDVVRTHFFLPRPALLDPVVTSSEAMLRFEGFSGCCGVYARADLPAEAFESDLQGRGTTNVDFNNPMRTALARLRDHDDARLSVGGDSVELASGDQRVVEKKVKLPVRWIKGFSEVQLYQPTMSLRMEASAAEARQFIRSLPRSAVPKQICYVTQSGKTLRLSQRVARGAIPFAGTHRVKILEPLLNSAKSLRIWADDESGVSGWEVLLKAGRFFLMLSPEVYRGFSGEGQALAQLAGERWRDALPAVQGRLKWQSQLDAAELARDVSLPTAEIEAAFAVLGARGLAGYDLNQAAYFHRELPFELDKVEQMQPRLKNARKLLEGAHARIITQTTQPDGLEADVEVDGTNVLHLVRLRPQGDKCTCPWFSKNQGQRGPCKHILAGRMLVDGADDEELA
ncbi:SWIM zinc finger family protein [Lacipirellula parvula]|uniref:SWIM-type domain-containing protein n=1 Tax=Lacipirellula parvula TaxID=2650471 RepID=A0A5K7X836_9BACT|nr:SWIM zinc finger family protein [Lacipirellula parvula]BBO32545.1 hypothetical protein PLANPX_2157 [Lacipirellula parvula]